MLQSKHGLEATYAEAINFNSFICQRTVSYTLNSISYYRVSQNQIKSNLLNTNMKPPPKKQKNIKTWDKRAKKLRPDNTIKQHNQHKNHKNEGY